MSNSTILETRDAMIAGGALRTDSKVRNLSPEHFEQVIEWCLQGVPMVRVVELCKKELNLPPAKTPSQSALYAFWRSFGPFWLAARRRVAAEAARKAGEDARQSPVDWKQANADAIEQITYELLSDPNLDPKSVRAFVTATLKLRDQDLAGRKLTLMEQKLGEAKQLLEKSKSAGEFTEEDRAAVLAAVDEAMGLKKR
jgi:hypothetical protein